MERGGGGGGGAAPTGCYKCGRPGHWSRDCLSHPSNGNNPNPTSTSLPSTFASNRRSTPDPSTGGSSLPKPKTVPRTRPKLTADSLLSDDGIGHVLRHFPRAFKYHGRGHEVSDLGSLLGLYSDWHSRLLPYYSFDQFVHKVEKIGASKRVKSCLRNLREKVATGVDPAKLQETEAQEQISNEQENMTLDEPSSMQKDAETNLEGDGFQQELNHDAWESIVKEASPPHHHRQPQGMSSDENGRSKEAQRSEVKGSWSNQITEEQRERMEASKLKALQKAAAAAAARAPPTAPL